MDDPLEIELPGFLHSDDPEPNKNQPLQVEDTEENRYSRLELITWWDQKRLRDARVMVVGAGALGNEILKNLALIGIGQILVVDLDTIENSNLSRSILFREGDEGKSKAQVAAERVHEINPDVQVQALQGNILCDVGLGMYRSVDVVLGGLDNREARLGINQACWKVNRPWVDGAIEVLQGVARVFVPPDSACYECTMNSIDFQVLNRRRSCALLTREEMLEGKVPTTPTTSSVIAGIQVQEAIKLLHSRPDLPVLAGKGFVYNGLNHDSYVVEYLRKEDCLSHDTFESVEETEFSSSTATLGMLLDRVRSKLGSDAVLEFDKEIATRISCQHCDTQQEVFKPLAKLKTGDALCPECGEARSLQLIHGIDGSENFLDRTLLQAGLPLWEIVTGRAGTKRLHLEMSLDKTPALSKFSIKS